MHTQRNEPIDDRRVRDDQRRERDREDEAPEDRPGEPGAEGGSPGPSRDKLPGMPDRDDPSPVGDTDQHSTS